MYHRTRNTRETWSAVTDPSLAALVGSALAVGLVPVAMTYLAGHLALAAGLLIGIGLSQLRFRLTGREADSRQPSNPGRTAELPVWLEGLDERQQATPQTSSD